MDEKKKNKYGHDGVWFFILSPGPRRGHGVLGTWRGVYDAKKANKVSFDTIITNKYLFKIYIKSLSIYQMFILLLDPQVCI
jgi:hypothetical protein